jgi:hypothetical protein
MWRRGSLAISLILAVFATLARAQLAPVQGLNTLQEVDFAQLTQRDLNPLSAKALAIHPEQWKHAEGEHFVYHFTRSYVATSVAVEAEFCYRVIAKELQREQPPGDTKSHIYIFENAEDWAGFQQLGQLEKWSGGIQSGGSLFIERDARFKFTNNTLGHEIAHLMLHRFYPEGVPCWINEGFAEYVSRTAQASFQRARGYIAKPRSRSIVASELIPLPRFFALLSPLSEQVDTFYDQAERLVRFLVATDKASFLTLLDALGRHQPFETAFARVYAGRFASAALLEERFREYASKDAPEQTTAEL